MSIPKNKNIKQVIYNGTTIPLAPTLQDKTVTSNCSATVTADAIMERYPDENGEDEITN